MAQAGKIYPDAAELDSVPLSPAKPKMAQAVDVYPNVAPLPPRSYYNVNAQDLPAPATYQSGRRGLGRGRGPCCCLLSCLCSICTILGILVGVLFLVFWTVIQPKAPKFHVQSVHISGLDANSGPVNTNITFELMARNPNKRMSFYYEAFSVNVQTDGVTIGDGSIPSFYQGHKNTTYLTEDLSSEGVTLSSKTNDLLNSGDNRNVPLYAEVDVKARVKVWSVKSRKIKIKVRCDLNVDLTVTDGSQLTYDNCSVKW